jgi:glycosyltransferase involved in cell wall biosynthesis
MVMVETMKNSNKKITFFYQSGRKQRLNSSDIFATEMFYGYQYFKEKNFNTEIIEFGVHKTLFGKYFFLLVERRLRNILRLPLYWSFITNKKNLHSILNSDYLIFSNNRMAASALPMLIYSKLSRKKITSLTFVMGLFSNKPKFRVFNTIQQIYLRSMLKIIDKYIFLSSGEFKYASENFSSYKDKFYLEPFAVDLKMWNKEEHIVNKQHILFIGNDGNRDFKLAEEISKRIKTEKFIFVSKEISSKNLDSNAKVIDGSWGTQEIQDSDLKKLYLDAKITIIPLKNSLQPSGQSVALQSLACGTPVLITKTDGFWDHSNFIDGRNIFFALENNIEHWVDKITEILNMEFKKINEVTQSGQKTINDHYDLNSFSKKIEKIITS